MDKNDDDMGYEFMGLKLWMRTTFLDGIKQESCGTLTHATEITISVLPLEYDQFDL